MPESLPAPPEVFSVLLILSTVFHTLGLILTSFRLYFRYHIRRLWWDDFWAALALACDAANSVTMWLNTAPLEGSHIHFLAFPIQAQSRTVHIITFWMGLLLYTCSIWFARLSIVFSVIRIVPPDRRSTIIAFSAAGAFACMWVLTFVSKAAICASDESWYDAAPVSCVMPSWVALSEVCTDALSDVILVVLPLRLLWRVKLPSNQKIMVLSVFSTSILVTVVSIVHTIYLLLHIELIAGVTAEIEGSVSLIVCNLLVVVTFLYRVMTNGGDLTAGVSGKDTTNTESSNGLTTVDLNCSGGSWLTSATATGTGSRGTGYSRGTMFTSTGTHVSSVKFVSLNEDKGALPSEPNACLDTTPTLALNTDMPTLAFHPPAP